jgi:ParB family chromosome partitioning protein
VSCLAAPSLVRALRDARGTLLFATGTSLTQCPEGVPFPCRSGVPIACRVTARAPDGDVQQALAEAYENKLLPGNQILAVRRIILQRNQRRKSPARTGRSVLNTGKITAAALIQSYETEAQRQELLVKKADLAQSRLTFIVNALRRLHADEEFLTLLRAEAMHILPRPLAEQLELSEV